MVQHSVTEPAKATRPGRGKLVVFFGIFGLVVVLAIAAGLIPRLAREKALVAATHDTIDRPPRVVVTAARRAVSKDGIELPGDLLPLIEAPIFARADGFVKRRLVDLGATVTAGQLMAELETPELDQQIAQARAALAQSNSGLHELEAALTVARANLKLASVTHERWKQLAAQGVFSRQDTDEKAAAFAMRSAETDRAEAAVVTQRETVRGNQSALARLEQMKEFALVKAPFAGIVTSRTTDVGTLINSGNGGPSKEMFRVAQIDIIRIFVNVPQTYVSLIHSGQKVDLRVQELPGQVFAAQVANISQSLDPASRAMLVVCRVANPNHKLYPGMYAQVKFAAPQGHEALVIPGDAIMLSRTGPRAAVVAEGGVVHFRNLVTGNDLGTQVEVTSGLSVGDLVISNPTDAIREGVKVEVHQTLK